jgi:hypothetical protein
LITLYNTVAVARTIGMISTTQTDGSEDTAGTCLTPSYVHQSAGDEYMQMLGSGFINTIENQPLYPKVFNSGANLEVIFTGYAIRIA